MKTEKATIELTNYASGTLRVSVFRFAGQVTDSAQVGREPELSGRKIDHAISTLPHAPVRGRKLTLAEVIGRFKSGELGSTEVPANQIWYEGGVEKLLSFIVIVVYDRYTARNEGK